MRASRSVRVAPKVRVRGSVVLGDGVVLGAGARIEAVGGRVVLGPGARLGERAIVVSMAGVEIGARAVVGDWAVVSDVAPGFVDVERPVRVQGVVASPVSLGDGAVIGPHASVSSSVGAGGVVAAYAVVGPGGAG